MASEHAGCPVSGPAWLYAGGGWISPRSLIQAWLNDSRIGVRTDSLVQHIERTGSGRWRVRGGTGHDLGEFDQLVLANADGIARLVPEGGWPLQRSRGQVTRIPRAPSDWRPLLPVAGDGYAIALPDGGLLCGATRDVDDDCIALRDDDHRRNLDSLQRLSGRAWPLPVAALDGRVAWRLHARDRLPLIGGVARPAAERRGDSRQDQPRFIARQPGLQVLSALGSRGLSQALLAAEVVAAMITGTPLPIGSTLLDAVDAARFDARAARQAP